MSTQIKRTSLVIFAGATLIVLVLLVVLFFPGKAIEASAAEKVQVALSSLDESVRTTMEEDPILGFSSNPYDYISDGKNEYYNSIIALGPEALPELERTLRGSDHSGLTEYLICIAIEEVSGADVRAIEQDPFAWSDADEFEKKWTEIKESLPESINEILYSRELSNQEKMYRIEVYGLLAVPVIEDLLSEKKLDVNLSASLSDYVSKHPLSESEKSALR